MNVTGILIAAAIVGGVGVFIGIFLGIAGKVLAVQVDERIGKVQDVLPGNNCGGCGFAGCANLAEAIVNGEAEPSACPVGGGEVAAKIAEILGREVGDVTPMVAVVKCAGTCDHAKQMYDYNGIEDCLIASKMQNQGSKACSYGCLGYGNCVKVCDFGALSIRDGIAHVDRNLCKACGKCVNACPKHLIELMPVNASHYVCCSSQDKGKDVMSVCLVGCIGCKLCTKVCEFDAITVENNIAHIDQTKCTGCGKCVEKCPKKAIH